MEFALRIILREEEFSICPFLVEGIGDDKRSSDLLALAGAT